MTDRDPNKEPVKILIVDDNPDKVLALEVVLEDLDEKIVRAYSGREALRQVLSNEFAVILLDVNMPDMDGFETATMIRKRRSSSQTPIIFVTSFGDEMHAARGYSLGAVDYILAPVLPDVLRTKVMVFVELFRKSRQLRDQADALRRRAEQQQRLAALALAIHADAGSLDGTLRMLVDATCEIVGTSLAVAVLDADIRVKAGHKANEPIQVISANGEALRGAGDCISVLSDAALAELNRSRRTIARVTKEQVLSRCEPHSKATDAIAALPDGLMVSALTGRDGQRQGMLYLAGASERGFSADDEAVIIQLTQLASITIENIIFTRDRDANRLKDEFLATLSHELRTPLSAILGWSELLKRKHGPKDIERGLEVIQRSVRSQMKLIEDLLDVSRINNGKFKVQLKEIRLQPVVAASIDAIKPTAEAKGIGFDVTLDDEHDDIFGDPDRLQQVICNLLGNAVKFSPQNSRVSLSIGRRGNNVSVRISDSGAGIDPAFLPYVFERFRQADSSSTRSHGGLGIGLAIVRHIIEMHGGLVSAESDGIGKGATFTFEVPLRKSSLLEGRQAQTNGHAALPDSATSSIEGMRILVVEDVADSREMLCSMLRQVGAVVSGAASAGEAMDAFLQGPPDLLISDIGMPGASGFDLIRGVRDLPAERGGCVPAIALTAYVREEDRLQTLSAGFQHHLAKPVEFGHLFSLVASYAGKGVPAAGAADQ